MLPAEDERYDDATQTVIPAKKSCVHKWIHSNCALTHQSRLLNSSVSRTSIRNRQRYASCTELAIAQYAPFVKTDCIATVLNQMRTQNLVLNPNKDLTTCRRPFKEMYSPPKGTPVLLLTNESGHMSLSMTAHQKAQYTHASPFIRTWQPVSAFCRQTNFD